jgi:hypothetical protein
MKFVDILKTVLLSDVDQQGSSKRLLLLWVGGALWTFIHVMVFAVIKPFNENMAGTLILNDVVIIGSLAGLNIVEKIWGRPKNDKDTTPPEPVK